MAQDDLAWIRASLEGLEIKGDHRHRIPGQLFDLSIEHHAGIITLISMATYASAFALVRCAFECFVRGAWIHYCASEQEIEAFVEKDTIAPKFGDLIKAIEERPEFSVKFLSTVKQSAWSAMNGYSQSGSFSRSEGYSEKAFSREQALEDVRRIDKRIAAIDEVSKSLSSNTSSRDGYGSNLSFDLSQIIASRYQEKAGELGLTAPSLARTDLSPQEQATAEVVARAIISDYYDQRVAPFSDLIPESGSLVGNVSGPGSFTEADLRGQGPRRSAGSPRNLVEGASDSAIGNRIEEGGQSLGQRYETNVTRSGQRRQDFQQDRKGEDGADDRFNERFYDRDQR
ncbi:hypothetical protein ATE77_21990 [Sphingopyxis sp. H005]|nr:hypothetical protein ATE76_22090 [Sphingopyxis sp. H093]KTE06228.1 hypothetical protein ATE70_22770 [Sphingopyxis sp. H053]KTE20374.1 hypothetical protein ATE75_21280 [Sphingopyxis sp. H080]KTE39210.1 hypothetical protein ATE77_21990 [Sphingopyxis sp. H005]